MPQNEINVSIEDAVWMAGILEGEGSFMKGPPSKPNCPRIAIEMTDEDVIERVSKIWNRKYFRNKPRKPHHKPSYFTAIKGKDAVRWMMTLRPLMGERRQEQIDDAISTWSQIHKAMITEKQREEIIYRHGVLKHKYKDIAKDMKLNQHYPEAIFLNRIQAKEINLVSFLDLNKFRDLKSGLQVIWIASYLEGEGCFRNYLKNEKWYLSVSVSSIDKDIIDRVAHFFNATIRTQEYKNHWKCSHEIYLSGINAFQCMKIVLPYMGERRTSKIQESIKKSHQFNL